jgi:SAM-dependent methyltransferase
MTALHPTERFCDRVANYIKYRPGYPSGIIPTLARECGLTAEHRVADIGSGTGILTQLFLDNGNQVYAVEPNAAMRVAGEESGQGHPNFTSIAGTAEATTLDAASVDFIVAGQAFHWFEPHHTRQEFARILRPNGWIILLWNNRLETDPFQQAYEQLLLTYGTDYAQINHRNIDFSALQTFLNPTVVQQATFAYQQVLDYEALQGRLMSCSYAPTPDHPDYAPMIKLLQTLFDTYQQAGKLTFRYQTVMYWAQW